MSQPTVTRFVPQKPVTGDGTTGKSRLLQRWNRWKTLVIIVTCVLLIGFLTTIIRPSGNKIPMHPQNAEPNGAMALTQILRNNGVEVTVTGSTAEARALADSSTTVFVYDTFVVEPEFFRAVYEAGSDLVIVDPATSTINQLDLGLRLENTSAKTTHPDPVDAQCAAPHAQSARQIMSQNSGFSRNEESDAQLCFTIDGVGPYAASSDNRVHLFATPDLFQNENLARFGNAALTIGALGNQEKLVWFLPTTMQNSPDSQEDSPLLVFLPPWFTSALVLAGFIAAALAVWRGRRMGRLVSEPLPVVVRGAETTVGLGQVYRRTNEVAHAASAIRAGAALRCAQRLGISPTSSSSDLAAAIARAVNRPYEEIAPIFLGPLPTSSADLIRLAQTLDHLESEVHSS